MMLESETGRETAPAATEAGGTGRLYLCATPIGNLEDITLRALRVLREVDLIAAEDTRQTRKLLARYDIHTPLTSYHEHNRKEKGSQLVDRLVSGSRVALVSDAGMPAISDPGEDLVRECLARGVPVIPIPGPSAVLTALVVSGLPTDRFVFEGFLPRAAKDRKQCLGRMAAERRTVIFYEAPHRLKSSLQDLSVAFGPDRPLAICRELTKRYEEVFRGTTGEACLRFADIAVRGELVLVIRGAGAQTAPAGEEAPVCADTIGREVEEALRAGASRTEALRRVAAGHGLKKRDVYRLFEAYKGGAKAEKKKKQ
jgi:16S rRNA (cytidine1402-2'-O)-methyltransferase